MSFLDKMTDFLNNSADIVTQSAQNAVKGAINATGDYVKNKLNGNNNNNIVVEQKAPEQKNQPQEQPQEQKKLTAYSCADGIKFYVGETTGELSRRGHANGLKQGQQVYIEDGENCLNYCVIGGIGAGKTTRVINPLLMQCLLHADMGGLIFDIKGDFCHNVMTLAEGIEYAEERIIKIGVNNYRFNLLAGLTPKQCADYLESTFYLTGGQMSDSFWVQSATNLIENALGVLQHLGSEYYNLSYLYQYVFFDDVRETLDILIQKTVLPNMEAGTLEKRYLENYRNYFTNVFMKLDIKMRESIKGTLSTILAPFQAPELVDAFGSGSVEEGTSIDLYTILSGSVIVVDLPLARWGTAGKVIYTLIKLRFFNMIQNRQFDKSLPQNYVFFLCDEYQNLISANKNGLSDLSFWDKSRSAKCIGIISTQSVSSFQAAISDKQTCDTIFANFRQKIFFKTEDTNTLEYMNKLGGRVEVTRRSTNYSSGESSAKFKFFQGTTTDNFSVNTSIVERQLIDANLVRQLHQNLAIAFLTIDGSSCDDVLLLSPIYL